MEQVRAFWLSVMADENEDIKNRLKASELLAKMQGEGAPEEQQVVLFGEENLEN